MTSDIPRPSTPAGWHPDPNMPGTQRYWNGDEWTDHVAPLSSEVPTVRVERQPPRIGWLVILVAIILVAITIYMAAVANN